MTKKLILIDGNSLAYRAFYALPESMKNSDGLTTNAIFGFTTMLLNVLEKNPDYIAIAFDLKAPTFRHKEYPAYKATRQKAPPTLHEQMNYIRQVAKALNISIYEKEGYEADDIIGTLAVNGQKEGLDVEIFTGDRDAFQIIDKNISVLRTIKGLTNIIKYDQSTIKKEYGLSPNQLIDVKALQGDSSDNIPGVPGIGEKGALKLIAEFGSLEVLLKNTDKIKSHKLAEKINQNKELALLSYKLATIIKDVPIEIDFTQIKFTGLDFKQVLPLFDKFNFKSLIKKYASEEYLQEKTDKKLEALSNVRFICLNQKDAFNKFIKDLNKCQSFAFDTETTGLNPLNTDLVGISICFEESTAYYIPLKHKSRHQLNKHEVIEALKPIFENHKINKYGHHLKFDIEVLHQENIKVNNSSFDTMLASYLIDPESSSSLKFLAQKYLGFKMLSYEEVAGSGAKQISFSDVEVELATTYSGSDANATFRLVSILEKGLKENGLLDLFLKVEMPLIDVLINMEETGAYIDTKVLNKLAKEMHKELSKIEMQIYILAGEEFNINSTKQLKEILFNKLKLPITKRTKTGPSTDASVLEDLTNQKYEIAENLLKHRSLNKLLNTYVEVLPELISPKDQRLHTSFNQSITATGRLSSSNPNLQNIPARGAYAKEIRSAFVPQNKNHLLISADYSQVELRILAHLSQDQNLTKDFTDDLDIHTATAAKVNGVKLEQVTPEMRSNAKAINFGIIYGISDFGLSKQLGIKREEAKNFIDQYFLQYPNVKKFMDNTIQFAKENGYVCTLLGRRRNMKDINSPNFNQRQFAERSAINSPVQGTAADLIKVAMISIYNELNKNKLKSKLILQVHDELVLEVPEKELDIVKDIVEKEMKNGISISVPIKVDIHHGSSWAEAK